MSKSKKDNFNSVVKSIKTASSSKSTSNSVISSKINNSNTSGLQRFNESGLTPSQYTLKRDEN